MESKKIESIFEDYLNKEKTNYALLISGKWGSGKTYLWKNVLEKKATEKKIKPIYVSLNGINNANEIESILFSKVMFADKLDNPIIKNSLNLFRNGANILGSVFAGGSKIEDLTKGMKLNLDLSDIVLCFDDLERSQMPIKEVLGLINDYTEHKNLKVVICAYEKEIEDKEYNKLKEKIVERILNYTANIDEIFDSYINAHSNKEFCDFLDKKRKIIIQFFEKHDIQNLRTFGFYLENLSQLHEFYKDESDLIIDRMLFFTAIISNEFKDGKLTVSNLKDKQGIDNTLLYFSIDELVENPVNDGEKRVKSYNEEFTEKYLSNQNEKNIYLFSDAIYEFILSGFLDTEKLKSEINKLIGKSTNSEEDKVYDNLMGYNFRMLENDEYCANLPKFLKFAEQGKYNMYSYPVIYNNLSYHIKIGSLDMKQDELINRLSLGLDISKTTSELNDSQMGNILHFKNENDMNEIERKILALHNEKRSSKKNNSANQIFEVIDKEEENINVFLDEILKSEQSLFEFVDTHRFYDKVMGLKNNRLLVFSNALENLYKIHYLEFPKNELPFFQTFKELISGYIGSNNLKNPKKIILEELLVRIDKIIININEKIERSRE